MAACLDSALRAINAIRNAGFSGGVDQGVPREAHRKRWALDSPAKVFIGQLTTIDGDPANRDSLASGAGGDRLNDTIFPARRFRKCGDSAGRLLSFENAGPDDIKKMVTVIHGPAAAPFYTSLSEVNVSSCDGPLSFTGTTVWYQMLPIGSVLRRGVPNSCDIASFGRAVHLAALGYRLAPVSLAPDQPHGVGDPFTEVSAATTADLREIGLRLEHPEEAAHPGLWWVLDHHHILSNKGHFTQAERGRVPEIGQDPAGLVEENEEAGMSMYPAAPNLVHEVGAMFGSVIRGTIRDVKTDNTAARAFHQLARVGGGLELGYLFFLGNLHIGGMHIAAEALEDTTPMETFPRSSMVDADERPIFGEKVGVMLAKVVTVDPPVASRAVSIALNQPCGGRFADAGGRAGPHPEILHLAVGLDTDRSDASIPGEQE